ncbi:c-type cytochrome [Sandarakinorhabdus sp.]|uniref:cytochrome c n=1 Tax=Sandarakinorhabdus sp. TaxID=1916663 RepID=UPI00286DE07C|nr:c-type cytochrome [Sandarakinorhabdus sp.]
MKRDIQFIIAVLVLTPLAFMAAVFWRSEQYLRSFSLPSAFTAAAPPIAAVLAQGQHVALTRGCYSCHGERLQGAVKPWAGRAVAVNLADYVRRYPIAIFERALRHGIGSNGRALYSMPSFAYTRLRDDEVAALYAWIGQIPVASDPLPGPRLDLPTRFALATGRDVAVPHAVALVPGPRWQGHSDPAVRRGEHLAMTICSECHGLSLKADYPWASDEGPGLPPPLTIAAAGYDKAAFVRLMRTGKGTGDRDLGLMSQTSRSRFVHWTDAEIDDLFAFLTAFGEKG